MSIITEKTQIIGHLDEIRGGCIYGWAIDQSAPEKTITVQLAVGQTVLVEGKTHVPRADMNGLPSGFVLPIPAYCFNIGSCEISVIAKDSGMVLEGSPQLLKPEHRFVFFIDGLIERTKISGWLKDRFSPGRSGIFTIELLEHDVIIATAKSDGLIDERGEVGRFVFELPNSIMDEDVHEFTFRCIDLDWEFGTLSIHVPSMNAFRRHAPPPFSDDPAWDVSPAGQEARKQWEILRTQKTEFDQKLEILQKQVAKAKPDDTRRRFDLVSEIAYLFKGRNDLSQAREYFDLAIKIDPTQPHIYCAVAELLFSQGKEFDAEVWLRKSLKILPEHPDLLKKLQNILALRRPKQFAKVIAFYLPQFHLTPENDRWWGKGFTEWTNVTAANPLFHGHLQPRRPTALGYYDLRVPEAVNEQFELASRYGIDGFCYYYYWFDGKRVLDRPLQDLVDGKTGPFPFCICWANEDWTRSWDGMSGEVLQAQNHTPESDFRFIQDVAPLLKHPDYIRHDGRPVLLIYRADKLASPKKTVKAWREWCRKEGIGELHLCAVQSFGFDDPRPLGFDAAVEFPPHCPRDKYPETVFHKTLGNLPGLVEHFSGNVYDYQVFADAFISRPVEPYQLHPGCFLAWDNTARRGKTAHVFHNFSIGKYQTWLTANLSKVSRQPTGGMVFINAWNEWAEGSVLEPDHHFGHGLLEVTRTTKQLVQLDSPVAYWKHGRPLMPVTRLESRERLLMVGHDAHPHGAQINMLRMARCLKRDMQVEVVILLMQGGSLVSEYERVGTTIVLGQGEGWSDTLASLARHYLQLGTQKAICNTAVTGPAVQILRGHGYQVVSLVHELPSLIESHHLQSACWHVAGTANNIVFASEVVAREFRDRYWPDPERILIAPQGITFNPYHAKRIALRNSVREELGLPANVRLVMGCGYADTRKGIDLFVQMAGELTRQADDVAFVWVGGLDERLKPYIQADIDRLGLENRLHITGRVDDAARYYIASDVFALTSREDPFPSVVMEAFDAGLPVVAFAGGGGYVDIVNDQTGVLVPYLDVSSMAKALAGMLHDARRRQRISKHVHHYCRATFGYPAYMRKLLALLDGVPARAVAKGILSRQAWYEGSPLPRISAIVPNYNYGRYLELRLRTILNQTLPPVEIIVLDDASTDYSRELIKAIAANSSIPIRLITNDDNTGNPFVQWSKGLAEASGELIWIAEADDYCEPILLETLAREMVDEDVVLAWCDSVVVDDLGQSQGFEYKTHYGQEFGTYWHRHFKMSGRDLVDSSLVASNVLPNASAVLFRRQAVDDDLSLIQHYRFSGDWWFWISLAEKGTVSYRAEALNYHRRHSQSVMGDVLRDGEKLVHETLAFYKRLAEHKPNLFSSKTVLAIFDRMESMYRLFSELQAESYRLKEHPTFKEAYQALVDLLNPFGAVGAKHVRSPAHLLISEDALADKETALRLIRKLNSVHELTLTLLCDENAAEATLTDCNLAANQITILEGSDRGAGKPNPLKLSENKSKPILKTLDQKSLSHLLGSTKHLITYGLLANCMVVGSIKNFPGKWQLVAGKEFDALLGNRSAMKGVTLKTLESAIGMASSVQIVNDSVPHALARLGRGKFMSNLVLEHP